jgi:hypothetical protein
MAKFCTFFYPFLGIAIAIILCLSLILDQQLHIRRKQSPPFDQQNGRLLLVILTAALLEIGLFFIYILSPKAGC